MNGVSVTVDGFTVDAAVLASAFAIDQNTVREKMRDGEITSLCETGVDDDAGRSRLTFSYLARALRLTVDASGTIVSKASFPIKPRPRP